jgi:hypothetical protein
MASRNAERHPEVALAIHVGEDVGPRLTGYTLPTKLVNIGKNVRNLDGTRATGWSLSRARAGRLIPPSPRGVVGGEPTAERP